MAIDLTAVLDASRELQRATDVRGLLDAARRAVVGSTRYKSAFLGAYESTPEGEFVRMMVVSGPAVPFVYSMAPRYPVMGDAMLQEILVAREPVVVVDARVDPRTNKDIVAQIGNRTIINVPLLLGGEVIGALGTGTFGDEGCLPPTPDELEILTVFGVQLAAAFDRVRLLDRERASHAESEALRRRLQQVERVEALGLLTGGVAHDFNNLLTIIMNSLHSFCGLDLSDQHRQEVCDAIDASNRAHEMTRALLALGRKQPLRLSPTDLAARLRELWRLLRRLIPERIEVALEEQPGLPLVVADGHQLDQVVMNLCLNARDAMAAGGRLTLRTMQSTLDPAARHLPPHVKAGPAVALEVEDTGSGMPPEVVERIFEPFFTTKGASLGTGLGLAVAQGIVEQHGGFIACRSVVGRGTTFTVTLPAVPRAEGVETTESLEGPAPRLATEAGGARILAAEDDPTIRELLRRVLSEAGYQVTIVADGQAAVDAALSGPFDLVLLDSVMPLLTGREVFERINPLLPRAAWVFMTGYATDTVSAEFLAQRGIELVEKPWLPTQLLAAIGRALDRSG